MVLLTGGAGYIGSHTCVALMEAGYDVILLDNYDNSSPEVRNRIEEITGKRPRLYEMNICDQEKLEHVFRENEIDFVIHFAGLKSVGESVEKPLLYYRMNLDGMLTLLETMNKVGVKNLIFSSSATVYGMNNPVPYTEEMPVGGCSNPYGQTKVMIETILQDVALADPTWNISILRYFNPIGAHPSGLIGEDPNGIPQNLCPYIAQVAVGKHEYVRVYGNDYDTPDGTGIRDYIHIMDLARGHVAAAKQFDGSADICAYNLGTGRGTSVLEMIDAFSKACGHAIPYQIMPRRQGDLARAYADVSKSERELGWKAQYDCQAMCEDLWRWQKKNPNGYKE